MSVIFPVGQINAAPLQRTGGEGEGLPVKYGEHFIFSILDTGG